jgi:hypothetical protein
MIISEKDKYMMMRYASYACDHPLFSTSADKVFIDHWMEGKERGILPQVFDTTPILEKEVKFFKSVEQIYDEFEEYMDMNYHSEEPPAKFYYCLKDHIYNVRESINKQYKKDPYDWGNSSEYESLLHLVNGYDIASNKFNAKSFALTNTEANKKVRIQNGEKTMRAILKVCEYFGWEDAIANYEEFRIFVSKLTNQKEIKGTLCLSIHPLDYMTMSDNHYDWSSCMSWLEDGCYKRGTLEMMNSSVVFVAYLKGEEPFTPCNGVEWNNKKWRQLFIADERLIASIKGYPYNNEALENEVMSWFKELAFERAGIVYQSINYEYKKNTTSSIIHLMDRPEDTCVYVSFSTDVMYNDFGCNGGIGHKIAFGQKFLDEEVVTGQQYNLYLNYSGDSYCLGCGTPSYQLWYSNEGQLFCDECEGRCCTCDNCDGHFSEDDLIYFNGNWYCPDCFEDATFCDPFNDERYLSDDSETLYLSFRPANEKFYASYYDMPTEEREKFGPYKSISCWVQAYHKNVKDNFSMWDEYFTISEPHMQKAPWGGYQYYVTLDELTDEGARIFGFNSIKDAKYWAIDN